ncbi:MAG: cytochrome c3 family protein [Zavarzinella sp.]
MPQIFPRGMNTIVRMLVFGLPLMGMGSGATGAILYRSGYITGKGEVVDQPVPFSHKHHVSELGIDCRFCHTAAETSPYAGIPPTETCMKCHQQMWNGSQMLNPVRASFENNQSIPWEKIHNLPDYAYFNHSIHLGKGVGCYSCHGEVDEMPLMSQKHTLLMEWCLKCHRNPEEHLRPLTEITNMKWKAEDYIDPTTGKKENPATGKPYTQLELGKQLKELHRVRDAMVITNCSICHR